MKKTVSIFILAILVFSFVGCGSKVGEEETKKPDESLEETEKQDENENLEETDKPEGTEEPDDSPGETSNLDGSLEDIINKIYETADLEEDSREYLQSGTFFGEITSENAEYHLGNADIEFEEALINEPMIQPGAYALVLLRVKEGANIEDIKTSIKDNVNPNKWVCVGVSEDNIIVDSIDDIVFLVMSDDNAQALHEGFLSLAE